MIELTIADMTTGKERGKLAIKPDFICSVCEEQLNNNDKTMITKIDVVVGSAWNSYWVTESYDRVLRLAKL